MCEQIGRFLNYFVTNFLCKSSPNFLVNILGHFKYNNFHVKLFGYFLFNIGKNWANFGFCHLVTLFIALAPDVHMHLRAPPHRFQLTFKMWCHLRDDLLWIFLISDCPCPWQQHQQQTLRSVWSDWAIFESSCLQILPHRYPKIFDNFLGWFI